MRNLKKKDGASNPCKSKDEKQTKISSFFGNKVLPCQKESALFTKICSDRSESKKDSALRGGHNSTKQGPKPVATQSMSMKDNKENKEDEVMIVDCDDFQEDGINRSVIARPVVNSTSETKELKPKDQRGDCRGKQNITLPKERLNFDEISKESPVDNADFQPQTNVSESALANCVFVTPDKKIQNTEHLSPDIICDTPGVDLELERSRTRKRQLSASRSFLCLSDRVSVQPGLKPAHLRAQRKVRPSKLLGKVSISFNVKSKSESDSTSSASFVANSNTTEMASDQKQSKPIETDDVFGSGQDGVTCESSALLSEKPCSIPETQLEERHKDPSTRVDDEIEQYFSEGDEPQKCQVFDQSAHELDMTVDKYLVAVESLEPDEVETEINQFSKKSMSWDRTEGRAGKDPLFNKKLSDNAEPKTICGKSKLLGALETADVRAKEKEDETAWLKDRVMREVGLLENKSSSGSGCKDTTPVKIYPGKTLTVKRLAKAGESPLSKRNYFSDCQSTEKTFLGEGNNDSFTSGVKKVLSFDSHSAKVSSKRYHKFTRQRAVEFGLKPKEKISAVGDKITLKDDRLLADLLGDLNSKSVVDNDATRYHKSTSLKSKKAINIKVSKEDEKLLDSLFGESFTGVDNDFGKGGISFSPIKSAAEDQTEPILIDDSEQPVVNGNDECIVVEEDSYYVETIVNDNELPSEEKGTILTKLASISAEEMRQSELRTSTGATTFIEKARPEKSSGSSTSLTNDAIDQRGNHSNVLSTENLSLDNSSAIDISNLEAEESKIPVSVYTDDQLSTSVCNMLSESFGDEFLAPQLPPPQGTKKKHQDFVFTDLWNRFFVEDTKYYRQQDELVLDLTCERSNSLRQCVLRGFWVDTEVKKGDIVNVLADLEQGQYIVDDKKGLVVVNPDILLSGTLVVSAVFCPRKSVLKEQFKGVDKGNVQMLYGSIIHSLFQEVLRDGVALEKDVEKLAVSRLKSNKFLHEMYGQNLAESTVMEDVKQYIPSLIEWLHKHTSVSNNSSTMIKPVKKPDVMVSEIQDIEENIWSPRFGIKGKIDLTVKAKVSSAGKIPVAKVLPLELKTGKASFSSEHKGQVQLYSMMCSDRRADPQEGILLYLKNGQMETVPVKPESQSGLVQLRNKLAKDLSRQVTMETDEAGNSVYQLGSLPKPINNERACSKCAHLQTCSIYQRSVEKIERPAGHAMSTLVPQALAHLGDEDLTYFLHWVLCLDVEGQVSGRRQLQEIWCSSSWQREKDGECLSNLVITGSELGIPESQSFNDGQGCSLFFSRHSDCEGASLNSVGLTSGDMVVLSSEDGRLIALATGFVRNISATVVEIVVDRDYLHNTEAYQGMKFRLDRNSSFSTSGYLFTNLAQLMNPDPQGSWLRDLIIKKRPPEFELKVSKANLYKVKSVFKPLNKPQRTAILKVLMAKDYVLIKGFPGTGKTSTIVALVKILHLLGLSVLLTSYTHSAVDNILLKLKKEDVPFVRLGRQGRIHPSILPCSAEVLTRSPSINSVQALREFYGSFSVVATSCLGVSNHPVFSQRHFDVCIVDEASQVLQPACLAPLFHCRKFVLVGDPKQLPPVVQSKEAKKLGMDVSLFALLDNRGATYDLSLQYRMNSVIMDLSNKLVYDGRLECGDPSVAEQCLKIDHSTLEDQPQWMKAAMSTQPQNSVVFVDTQQISAPELQDGKGLKNETEARIVLSLLKTLISGHVSGSSIGVISPYRSQVRLLQRMVAECSTVADVEVNTVDQYQGRDKGVIIVSFVRSQKQNEGELLKDLRRLNVALTRARYKLILVGNSSALQVYENLAALLDWLHPSQNVITIPEDYTPDS